MNKNLILHVLTVFFAISLTACEAPEIPEFPQPPGVTEPPADPVPSSYTVSGNVSGLSGIGLVLQNNGTDNLSLNASGGFTFSTALNDGSNYSVSVQTQPGTPAQSCVVSNGSGTISGANVANVAVSCTTIPVQSYSVSGSVSGLSGSGLVLQNNGADNLSINTNGSFTFPGVLNDGSNYSVTVQTQPGTPAQTCNVSSGSGTINSSNITNVSVSCTTVTQNYSVSGSVSGLSGTGLVLQNNGADNLSITTNGSFTFVTALTDGIGYNVTILSQPTSPSQHPSKCLFPAPSYPHGHRQNRRS